MKYTTKRMLALLIAILLAMPTMTFAEAPVEDALIIDDAINGIGTLPEPEGDPEIEGAGDIPQLDISDDLLVEAPLQDALQPEADTVVTYCFIVNDTFVAVQEAREGDEINRPADPDTPEGQAFAGWFLGDGTALFVDADGDGMIDPVIAHPDGIVSQISVYARFAEIEAAQAQTEAPAEEPAEEPTETFTEVPTGMSTEEPTEVVSETPAETPTEAQTVESEEKQTEVVGEALVETQSGEPTGETVEVQTVEPTEEQTEVDPEEPTEETAGEEAEETAEEPAEGTIEEPAEETADRPIDLSDEASGEDSAAEPTGETEEAPVEMTEETPSEETAEENPEEIIEENPEENPEETIDEAIPASVEFNQTQTVSGVTVTVKAAPGVFRESAELVVKRVPTYKQRQADAAIEEVRDEEANVAVSYTFDIKVIDPETKEELQPA